jgi:hypothetical protein
MIFRKTAPPGTLFVYAQKRRNIAVLEQGSLLGERLR